MDLFALDRRQRPKDLASYLFRQTQLVHFLGVGPQFRAAAEEMGEAQGIDDCALLIGDLGAAVRGVRGEGPNFDPDRITRVPTAPVDRP